MIIAESGLSSPQKSPVRVLIKYNFICWAVSGLGDGDEWRESCANMDALKIVLSVDCFSLCFCQSDIRRNCACGVRILVSATNHM